jgi:hypothetical protein
VSLQRVAIPSPCYSSRGGSGVRLIVLHTAEGSTSYQSLGAYFANPNTQASSHVGIDDTPGVIGEYVPRSGKAWTQANANPYSVSAELCAFAKWTASDWAAHPVMLQNCAAWIAEEAAALGIPIVALTAAQAQGGAAGVCAHVDLGAAGGGHWDCGTSFPMAQVIDMALGGAAPSTQGGAMAICRTPSGAGYWIVGSDGGIFTYGDAEFFGSLGDTALSAPITDMASTPSGCGYWLLGADGGVFTFGDAEFFGAPTGLVK